jgi:hypothetical protein
MTLSRPWICLPTLAGYTVTICLNLRPASIPHREVPL